MTWAPGVRSATRRQPNQESGRCRRRMSRGWNSSLHRPTDELTTEETRIHDTAGEVCVVALGDPRRAGAVWEVNWAPEHLGVWFLDRPGRPATPLHVRPNRR